MNLKIVTIDRLREFLNKFSKVATSGKYSDLSGTPNLATVATSGKYSDLSGTPNLATVATSGKYSDLSGTPNLATVATSGKYSDLSGTPNLATVATSGKYSDLSGIPTNTTYTAGVGIKIENGVISIISRTKVGNPTCPGYTLYGDYFLSNTVTTDKNWDEACAMTERVTVTQKYNYGSAETKTVSAYILSKIDVNTLTAAQRKFNNKWYWTSTIIGSSSKWLVDSNGNFGSTGGSINYGANYGGARLGFKNPFI